MNLTTEPFCTSGACHDIDDYDACTMIVVQAERLNSTTVNSFHCMLGVLFIDITHSFVSKWLASVGLELLAMPTLSKEFITTVIITISSLKRVT